MRTLKTFQQRGRLARFCRPHVLVSLTRFVTFTRHCTGHHVPLPKGHDRRLVVLHTRAFSGRRPPRVTVSVTRTASCGKSNSSPHPTTSRRQIQRRVVARTRRPPSCSLQSRIVRGLVSCLGRQGRRRYTSCFALHLVSLPARRVRAVLGLAPHRHSCLRRQFGCRLLHFTLSRR